MNNSEPSVATLDHPALLSVKQARFYLGGIARSTLYQLIASREITPYKLRNKGRMVGRTVFMKEDLDKYVTSLRNPCVGDL